jgi:hypothetical protein
VGFFGLSVPSDPGGAGLGCMSALLVMEGLGLAARQWSQVLRYRPGLSHHPHDAAVATDEHKRRYLPGSPLHGGSGDREFWHPARMIRGDNRDLNNRRFALYRVGTTSRTIEAR